MATLRELVVKISANSSSFQSEIARASRMGADYYKTMENGGKKAAAASRESERALSSINSQLNSLRSRAGGLAGIFTGAFATQQLIHYADTWTQLNSRLKLASTSTMDFTANQRRLMDISQRTGTSLEANTNMFSRMSKAMQQMGYSSADTAKVTELVATSLRLSGAGAGEAASVITQFGQAMASGVLRGDEFNSIMENGGRFAQALADGLGVTVGKLRAMAMAGELTTNKIMPALMGQLAQIRKEGEQMGSTVASSMQRVQNSFLQWVGTSNDGLGASSALASGLDYLAKNLSTVADVAAVVVAGGLVRYLGNMVTSAGKAGIGIFETQRAEVALAAAQLEGTKVSTARARAAVYRAEQALVAARGTDGQAAAETRLAAAQIAAARNVEARTAAQARLNSISSLSSRIGSGLLGLVGGIPGIIMGIGAAWMYVYEQNQQAKQKALEYADTLEEVVKHAKDLSAVQLKGSIAEASQSIDAQKDKIAELRDVQESARAKMEQYKALAVAVGQSFSSNNGYVKKAADAQREYDIASRDVNDAQKKLNDTIAQQNTLQDTLNGLYATSGAAILGYTKSLQTAIGLNLANANAIAITMDFMRQLNAEAAKSGAGGAGPAGNTSAQDKALKEARQQADLASRKGTDRAAQAARYKAADLGFASGSAGEKELVDLAIKEEKAKEAATAATKAHNAAVKAENKEVKDAAQHQKQFKEQIANLNTEVEEARIRAEKGAKAAQEFANAHQGAADATQAERDQIAALITKREEYNALAEANSRNEKARTALEVERQTRGAGDEEAAKIREKAQATEDYNNSVVQTQELYEKYIEQLDLIDEKYDEARKKAADWVSGMKTGFKNWAHDAGNYAQQAADAVKNGMDGLVTNITDMLNGNKASWKDWASSVLQSIEKILVNMAIVQGLKSLGGAMTSMGGGWASAGSALTSALASAKGNVFSGPGIHAYSNSIVSRPTAFAFAKGAGIMGEAGPEAVMPLVRGSNGRLGVTATNGGSNIVINSNVVINGDKTNSSQSGSNDDVGRAYQQTIDSSIQEGIRRELKPGGLIWNARQKR